MGRTGRRIPPTDVLITLMGTPHANDTVTNTLRMVQAILATGASVQVWTCGYATMLTQVGLGEHKPRNLAAWETDYPSTATIIGDLLAGYPDRLYWYGCRFCSDDRGAVEHLPQVVLRAPARYTDNVAAAAKTVQIGLI